MVPQMRMSLLQPEVLSDIPSFVSSENPGFADFCDTQRKPKHVARAFADSITAGKNTYVYDAHTYHTKVPPQGIAKCIEYYTEPGQVILDPFCGSGMTGIAALELDRSAVLSDLSPAAAFIAHNLCSPMDSDRYISVVETVLKEARDLERMLYGTHCRTCGRNVNMLYTVWSYGLICRYCNKEFIFWDVGRDEQPRVRDSKVKSEIDCPHCDKTQVKRGLKRTRRYPVSVGYRCCRRSLQEDMVAPDAFDKNKIKNIERQGVPADLWYPRTKLREGVNTRQAIVAGIDSIDKLYTTRALWAMSALWKAASAWPEADERDKLLFTLTSLYQRVTVLSEFRFWGGSGNVANYNVPILMNEQNVFRTFRRKAQTIALYFQSAGARPRHFRIGVQPAQDLHQIPDKAIDYIFTDPPFGANINYSEMNLIWESWLGSFTATENEAIVNRFQKKGYNEYERLLEAAFREARRVLKDDAWMTVVFHNSSSKAWSAIQDAITCAGFDIVSAGTFDKQHGTFKMFVSDNAVGYDLVLHCRKSAKAEMAPHSISYDTEAVRSSAKSFIARALKRSNQYRTVFLHVNRKSELDSRRLYSEWLASSMGSARTSLDFEEFRSFISDFLSNECA